MTARERTLGNYLTRLNQGGRLSDAEIANRVGISRAQLNRIRNGRAVPRLDTAMALSRVLGYRVREVFYIRRDAPRRNRPS